jgi:RNA polymerase sigma factor (sigma-70 family)
VQTTRVSLLNRVQAGGDEAWREFFAGYGGLIVRYALSRGLSAADAEDARQLTLLKLTHAMRSFEYDRRKGRFRSYLHRVVVSAISEMKLARPAREAAIVASESAAARDGTDAPSDADPLWDREWLNHHYRRAMETMRRTRDARSMEVFAALVAGESTDSAAERFAMSADAVRKIRQRLLAEAKSLVAAQIEEEDAIAG